MLVWSCSGGVVVCVKVAYFPPLSQFLSLSRVFVYSCVLISLLVQVKCSN